MMAAELSRRSLLFGAAGLAGAAIAGVTSSARAEPRSRVPAPHLHSRLATRPLAAPAYPGQPRAGKIYCGVKVDDAGNDPSAIEAELHFIDGLHRAYFVPGQEAALLTKASVDVNHRRLPMLSTKVPGTWQQVADGACDGWLSGLIQPLQQLGHPVWFTLHHEPWDDQGDGCTPDSYIAMYRHTYAMTAGSNVALVPIMQSWPFYSWIQQPDDVLKWFDPDACDVLGLDGYNPWYSGAPDSAWKQPEQILDVASQLTTALPGKPIAYGEWGVRTDARTPGKAAQWMHDFYDLALTTTNTVGICYYSSSINSPHGPWTLDGERLDAFDELVHDRRTAKAPPSYTGDPGQ